MRIFSLYNSCISDIILENTTAHSIRQILDNLHDKSLIVFDITTTGQKPGDLTQIIKISAIVIDADTGEELDVFDMEADLNISTMSEISRQDALIASEEWAAGEPSIRDILNATDYAIDSSIERPSDAEIALWFKEFVERYSAHAILVAFDANFMMQHLNETLSEPIRNVHVIDIKNFVKIYFEPLLKVVIASGGKRAEELLNKISVLTPHSLGSALKVHSWGSDVSLVRKLAGAFSKIIQYIKSHMNLYNDPRFRESS